MTSATEYNKTFNEDNFRSPTLKANLKIVDIPIELADNVNIKPFGALINNKDDCKVEIVPWPTNGWRNMPVELVCQLRYQSEYTARVQRNLLP